jgi:hypothetical protein
MIKRALKKYCKNTGGGGIYAVFRRVRKIAKSDYLLRRVCLSVCMEQLHPHWSDFH